MARNGAKVSFRTLIYIKVMLAYFPNPKSSNSRGYKCCGWILIFLLLRTPYNISKPKFHLMEDKGGLPNQVLGLSLFWGCIRFVLGECMHFNQTKHALGLCVWLSDIKLHKTYEFNAFDWLTTRGPKSWADKQHMVGQNEIQMNK